jgi:U3 small nucleolar RNA-associated protein 3
MGKKRKTSGKAKDSEIQYSSKLALNSWEDVADSEDEFLINQDKILLNEGPEVKRRRKLQEEGIWVIS